MRKHKKDLPLHETYIILFSTGNKTITGFSGGLVKSTKRVVGLDTGGSYVVSRMYLKDTFYIGHLLTRISKRTRISHSSF